MEKLEIDDSLLSSDISRRSFVNLGNFCNKRYCKTRFHVKFMAYLQNLRFFNRREFTVSGLKGIGKSFTLVYFMLDCLKKKDESVHYIDLQNDFEIETFFEYAKKIKNNDLIIIDHVTLFNKHHIAEIRKQKNILILTVETGFTASIGTDLTFGKNWQLDEEEFNQIWIAQQNTENSDVRERGREVYREGVLNGLSTARLLHTFFYLINSCGLSLCDAVSHYILEQRKQIDDFLKSQVGEEYQIFLLHSRILLHYLDEDGIILTVQQFKYMRIAINIFDFQRSCVTKENLEQDSRFLELGLEENNNYYRVTHLVPSFADIWKQRLPYHFELVLESTDCKNLVNIMFQNGGGRKEIEKMVVEAHKKYYIAFIPLTAVPVPNTTYMESENDCFIPQVKFSLRPLEGEVFTLKLCDMLHFNTKFASHAKNVAKCAMWIKEKVEAAPNQDFILHPDISNLMGVDYFCKVGNVKEGTVQKKPKYENCLFLVQVATGTSHNGKTVGEALKIVKEVLAEVDITIHLVIAIISESQSCSYCLKKCSFQNASVINLANNVFMELIKQSNTTLFDFITEVKSLNK